MIRSRYDSNLNRRVLQCGHAMMAESDTLFNIKRQELSQRNRTVTIVVVALNNHCGEIPDEGHVILH